MSAKPGWGVKSKTQQPILGLNSGQHIARENISQAVSQALAAERSTSRHLGDKQIDGRSPGTSSTYPYVHALLSLPVTCDRPLRAAGHPEAPWAMRTAPPTTRWVAGNFFPFECSGSRGWPGPLQPVLPASPLCTEAAAQKHCACPALCHPDGFTWPSAGREDHFSSRECWFYS